MDRFTIGYVDEQKKQFKKYKRRLEKYFDVIGYNFEKGMTLEDLMKQIYESNIDLLIIDYKLNETNLVSFNGEEIESQIYDKMPLFPYIIFTNKIDQAEPHVEDLKNLYNKRDSSDDGELTEKFVEIIKRSIHQYKKHIKNKRKEYAQLREKVEKEELSTIEKDRLIFLQKELRILFKIKIKEVPEHLLNKMDNLEKMRIEAEKLLQSLVEKRKNR